jgi:hypothetical protein
MTVEQKIAHRGLRHTTVRLLASSVTLLLQRCESRFWIILLWLFGIPLTTIVFLTMLFWAYGVDG